MSGEPPEPRASLLPLFAREADRRLDAIAGALADEPGRRREAAREAHTLLGSAAVLGLEEIAAEAERLETAVARGAASEAVALVARLRGLVAALPRETAEPGARPPEPDEGPHVLYVEDSEANARLVERVLASGAGLTVVSAATGEEGCRLASERPPALVLLDLQLPDMSGEEVVRRLAARPETRAVPVVAVTGGAAEHRLQTLRRLGVRSVLAKPYAPDALLAAVAAALEE